MQNVRHHLSAVNTVMTHDPFPQVPWSWYYACNRREMRHRPVACSIGARELVLFSQKNAAAAMERRCVHMGADLARGRVANDRIICPFHEWEFAGTGKCVRIPAAGQIPGFACQQTYPAHILGPHVLVFNHTEPLFDLPFFDGVSPADLMPAAPFLFEAEMPWYMVAANGFDLQHFRAAHDRTLVEEPVVSSPHPFAYRIKAVFDVTGNGLRDRLTRRFSGPRVSMTITSYCGTMVLVSAQFARTTSYGMVFVRPVAGDRCQIRIVVWVPRRSGAMRALDPLDALIRRWFIRDFLRADQDRTRGIRYNPSTLIEADQTLAGYFQWLGRTVRGESLDGKAT